MPAVHELDAADLDDPVALRRLRGPWSRCPGRSDASGALLAQAGRRWRALASLIDALVAHIARMPLTHTTRPRGAGSRRIEPLPQVLVLYRLLVGRAPAARLPVRQPLDDARADVLGVGVAAARARRASSARERHDGPHQLHAVVGRLRFGAGELLLLVLASNSAPQPPGPGLPRQAPSV